MTKQQVIDEFDKYKFEMMYNISVIPYSARNDIADTLLAKFEQEKKEQAREIFRKVASPRHEVGDTEIEYAWFESELKDLAKEYGVEL